MACDPEAKDRTRLRDVIPAVGMLAFSTLALLWLTVQPPETARQVAVVFPPGMDFEAIVGRLAEAGARPMESGPWDNVIVADLGGMRQTASLSIRDAWAILDPVELAGCFAAPHSEGNVP